MAKLYKNTDLFDVYIIDPHKTPMFRTRKTGYSVASPEGRLKVFSGRLKDAEYVLDMYDALWSKVVDERLGTRPVRELTDDNILSNWESCDIVAIDQKHESRQWIDVGGSHLEQRWCIHFPRMSESL